MTLKEVKKNPQVLEFLRRTDVVLKIHNFTEHGLKHANLVADRARTIAKELGLPEREQESAAISGFLHDFANFLSRTYHNYLGALIFLQIFKEDFPPGELAEISQAIANHDEYEMKLSNPISAILILADKSHVHRSRVVIKDMKVIKSDIHNRVNFAVTASRLKINRRKRQISLILKIDTNFIPVIEYFEIFTERMVFCRKAAEYLGYKFGLVINNFKLL